MDGPHHPSSSDRGLHRARPGAAGATPLVGPVGAAARSAEPAFGAADRSGGGSGTGHAWVVGTSTVPTAVPLRLFR